MEELPVIGKADRLDITVLVKRGPVDRQYLIRLEQNRKEKTLKISEVLVKTDKPFVFDCLNLQRYVSYFYTYVATVHAASLMQMCMCACYHSSYHAMKSLYYDLFVLILLLVKYLTCQ